MAAEEAGEAVGGEVADRGGAVQQEEFCEACSGNQLCNCMCAGFIAAGGCG